MDNNGTETSITNYQIQALMTEAASAGDHYQVQICRTALKDSFHACDEDRAAIEFARDICADVIANAEAQS